MKIMNNNNEIKLPKKAFELALLQVLKRDSGWFGTATIKFHKGEIKSIKVEDSIIEEGIELPTIIVSIESNEIMPIKKTGAPNLSSNDSKLIDVVKNMEESKNPVKEEEIKEDKKENSNNNINKGDN